MSNPTVSVVVVSRDRPESLLWCLSALAGVQYQQFEVVVVADESGCSAILGSVFATRVKLVRFDEANISAARNKGIAQAAGGIIAFIDDDAAAEPMWLHHLVQPLENSEIACAGGYVRGRNGISFQWTAREVGFDGAARPLEAEGTAPFEPHIADGFAVKTEGTNMAIRRNVLQELGGFDPAFHFFLDETDLNLRLSKTRHKTVLVPLAEVHHAYKASPRRRDDRAVTDLFDVGASTVVLLRKHNQPLDVRCAEMLAEQAQRLDKQVKRRLLTREAAESVLQSLKAGFAAGETRDFGHNLPKAGSDMAKFKKFEAMRGGGRVVAGRWRNRRRLRAEAAELSNSGLNVSLFLFSPDTRFHRVRFDEVGYWEQMGGQFGRSERDQPLFQPQRFQTRLGKELARVAAPRGLIND